MLYQLDVKPGVADTITRLAIAQGRPVPERFLNPPTIAPVNMIYWRGFHDLCSHRIEGGPIPWQPSFAWAIAHDFDTDEADEFCQIVRLVDMEYLAYTRKKQEENAKKERFKRGKK